MKTIFRYLLAMTLKPFLQHYYLKKTRKWRYKSLILNINPGVFHPGLFFSSKFLADYIASLNIRDKTVLEIGCGSGFLSLVAANAGAQVTGVDISPDALQNTNENALQNSLSLTTIESNVFEKVTGEFSYIIVNPPYYAKSPKTPEAHAWYCGENHAYFEAFFNQLPLYITPKSIILMVLSESCELCKIEEVAKRYKLKMTKIRTKKTILEMLYIYEITLHDA